MCKAPPGHTFTAVAPCHKLVVQGGLNHDNGYLEDVHMLCTDTLQWSGAVETTNKGPCAVPTPLLLMCPCCA